VTKRSDDRGRGRDSSRADEWADRLANLFSTHPAWLAAARHLSDSATSTVYLNHPDAEPWRLEQRDGAACLLRGAASDPDLVFRFTPASIEGLEAVEGGIGRFAVVLFSSILAGEVDLRIAASFARLMRRGYVGLLLIAGPPVLAFGVRHGIGSVGQLRRLVQQLRASEPADWES